MIHRPSMPYPKTRGPKQIMVFMKNTIKPGGSSWSDTSEVCDSDMMFLSVTIGCVIHAKTIGPVGVLEGCQTSACIWYLTFLKGMLKPRPLAN